MKVLALSLILFGFQLLLSEGVQVAKIKKGGNVYVNVIVPHSKKIFGLMKILDKKLNRLFKAIGSTEGSGLSCPNKRMPKNCAEVLKCGGRKSRVYTIKPDSKAPFKVYCDQKTNGGGWTVFQRRKDGSVNFYRGWTDYKNGFGDLRGEFWLGLEKIYRLTHQTRNRLHVDLEDTSGARAYADYDYFAVSSERSKYSLSLGTYTGTAGDSMSYHRGMAFSTKDRDNDKWSSNCAVRYKGAWWHNSCHYSNLNGQYLHGKTKKPWEGVVWYHWKGHSYSLKGDELKIKPL